ncbi:LysR family transcriptional regulator [Bacillus tuaregi]|uniref:LysR family transcriptional regulator n=1 Tax=Bacillus tuaregi TaxID=1816695 RepID=UPI0008F8A03A|nr:LysR family transcriptional regulator [Bacillus tuaregi]
MNFNQLQYFCVLAETEHYTKAAKLLAITQPSLTHSIKELEKDLGVCLFNKQGRNVKINQYGYFLYEHVRPILSNLEKTRNELQILIDPRKGTINLSFVHTLSQHFIPKLIHDFLQVEENNQIQFALNQGTTEEIKEGLRSNKIDIAFTSKIADEGITSVPIMKQELMLITPNEHPLAGKQEIDLVDAAKYPFIYYNQECGLRPTLDELFNCIHVKPHIAYEVDDDSTVCGFVAANLGIAVVPNIYRLDRFPVKALKIINPPYEPYIYLSYCTYKFMSPPVTKLKDYVLSTF